MYPIRRHFHLHDILKKKGGGVGLIIMARHNNSGIDESAYSGFEVIYSRAPLSVLSPEEETEKYIHIQNKIEKDEYADLAMCEVGIRRFMSGLKIGSQGEFYIITNMVNEEIEKEMEQEKEKQMKKNKKKKKTYKPIKEEEEEEDLF